MIWVSMSPVMRYIVNEGPTASGSDIKAMLDLNELITNY